MIRLGRRALQVFGAYAVFIFAMIIAGFLGAAVGIWATVIWAVLVIAAIALYVRGRAANPAPD